MVPDTVQTGARHATLPCCLGGARHAGAGGQRNRVTHFVTSWMTQSVWHGWTGRPRRSPQITSAHPGERAESLETRRNVEKARPATRSSARKPQRLRSPPRQAHAVDPPPRDKTRRRRKSLTCTKLPMPRAHDSALSRLPGQSRTPSRASAPHRVGAFRMISNTVPRRPPPGNTPALLARPSGLGTAAAPRSQTASLHSLAGASGKRLRRMPKAGRQKREPVMPGTGLRADQCPVCGNRIRQCIAVATLCPIFLAPPAPPGHNRNLRRHR